MVVWQAWKNRAGAVLFAGLFAAQFAAAAPALTFTTSPVPVTFGDSVALDVKITDVTDLYGYQFTLNFDPVILSLNSVSEGSFLPSAGSTFFGGGTIDNTAGTVSFVFDSLLGSVPGATGDGVLATFNFVVQAVGTSAITFSDVAFVDSNLIDITVSAPGGSVTAVPEPAVWALFGLGLAGVGLNVRRFAKQA